MMMVIMMKIFFVYINVYFNLMMKMIPRDKIRERLEIRDEELILRDEW